MTSMFNIFSDSNLDNRNKVSNYYKSKVKPNNNNKLNTTSLTQGQKFIKYQKKIEKNLSKNINYVNSKEGFTDSLSQQTYNILNATSQLTSPQGQAQTGMVTQQFNNSLSAYEDAETGGNNEINDYYARISPKNPYLNSNIQFTSGEICYVTNQGVVKWYPNYDIWMATAGSNNCPSTAKITKLDIAWSPAYNSVGATIPTTPTLITGTPMTQGQSCGYEGTNVYVNAMVGGNVTSSYKGCFADNSATPAMTYIGAIPPVPPASGQIENPDFDYPEIPPNSYDYIDDPGSIYDASWTGSGQGYVTIPGWYSNSMCLINNSTGWNFPIPYPNGNQAACLQNLGSMTQTINLTTGTYMISFYAVGRPSPSAANTINITYNPSSNTTSTSIGVLTPSGSWQNYNFTFNIPQNTSYNISFAGTGTNANGVVAPGGGGAYYSTAIQHIIITPEANSGGGGTYTEQTCKEIAMYEGYKYYALQDANVSGYGYCAVSNDYISASQYGNSTVISNEIVLWQTNTTGTGNTATLNNSGCLVVTNSSGTTIFTTPNTANIAPSYIGCYGDNSNNRALPVMLQNSAYADRAYDVPSCQQAAASGGYNYFGLQFSNVEGQSQCFLGNDFQQATEYGIAGNCTTFADGTVSGGSDSNAIYNTGIANPSYFLSLTDDGLLAIYLGSNPNDSQELIWSFQANPQQPNPDCVAENGINGTNWLLNGTQTINAGQFIGSPNGYCALYMRASGNLVLLTFQTAPNCSTINGSEVGGVGANAIYELSNSGNISNMGQLAYIDQNSTLYPYESTNISANNVYTKIKYFDSSGNNLSNASFSNATETTCKAACDSNDECYGFSIINGVCYPKNNQMYPTGQLNQNQDSTLYIRNTMPNVPPYGVDDNTNNVNSIQYQNYATIGQTISNNGESINGSGGVFNILNPATNPTVQNLQNQLYENGQQVLELSNAFNAADISVNNQSKANIKGLKKYMKEYNKIQNKIMNDTTNSGIFDNSNIKVLQQNYNYMFWSILAIGTVIVSMNVAKFK